MFNFDTPRVREKFKLVHKSIKEKHGEKSILNLKNASEIQKEKKHISEMFISTWTQLDKLIFDQKITAEDLDLDDQDCEYLIDLEIAGQDEKYHLFISLKILWQHIFSLQGESIPLGYKCYDPEDIKSLDNISEEAWVNTVGGIPPSFRWIVNIMPLEMYRKHFSTPEMLEAKKLTSDINSARLMLKGQVEEIISKASTSIEHLTKVEEDAKDLEDRLTNVKREGNFKLLAKAFSTLRIAKRTEVRNAQVRMWVFIILLILVPVFSFLFFKDQNLESLTVGLFRYLPIISLEILFFYFMRLFYIEVKSLKSQLVQIDLRLNLCEFIYDYIETRDKTHSDKVSDSWKAFESLIFSPIQPNEDKIPSVMDGTDVLADLAGKILKART